LIKGKDLDALSDDPDELQSELTALAGPSSGPNGAQIFIDGFTGGQLPPKSSIREIRINQNPFSAHYDKLGYGRIEILTKPGTDKIHGNMMVMGNDSSFNSLNPFVSDEPPYYSVFANGSVGGSVGKKTSWFGSVFYRNSAANSIINAYVLGPSGDEYNYAAAVANPQSRLDISPRFDFQLGDKNTLTVRYMFDRQVQTNSGVSQFALESQAYSVSNYENSLQASDTQIINANTVNETRFQYVGARTDQVAQSVDPTVTIRDHLPAAAATPASCATTKTVLNWRTSPRKQRALMQSDLARVFGSPAIPASRPPASTATTFIRLSRPTGPRHHRNRM
jgi:hypothetical protein